MDLLDHAMIVSGETEVVFVTPRPGLTNHLRIVRNHTLGETSVIYSGHPMRPTIVFSAPTSAEAMQPLSKDVEAMELLGQAYGWAAVVNKEFVNAKRDGVVS